MELLLTNLSYFAIKESEKLPNLYFSAYTAGPLFTTYNLKDWEWVNIFDEES